MRTLITVLAILLLFPVSYSFADCDPESPYQLPLCLESFGLTVFQSDSGCADPAADPCYEIFVSCSLSSLNGGGGLSLASAWNGGEVVDYHKSESGLYAKINKSKSAGGCYRCRDFTLEIWYSNGIHLCNGQYIIYADHLFDVSVSLEFGSADVFYNGKWWYNTTAMNVTTPWGEFRVPSVFSGVGYSMTYSYEKTGDNCEIQIGGGGGSGEGGSGEGGSGEGGSGEGGSGEGGSGGGGSGEGGSGGGGSGEGGSGGGGSGEGGSGEGGSGGGGSGEGGSGGGGSGEGGSGGGGSGEGGSGGGGSGGGDSGEGGSGGGGSGEGGSGGGGSGEGGSGGGGSGEGGSGGGGSGEGGSGGGGGTGTGGGGETGTGGGGETGTGSGSGESEEGPPLDESMPGEGDDDASPIEGEGSKDEDSEEESIKGLSGIWQAFLRVLETIFDWVWKVIVYIGQAIWDFFFGDPDGFLWWLLKIFGDWALWFVEQLPDISSIVETYSSSISVAMELVSKLDKFFPVTEAVWLLFIFLAFLVVFLCAKLILKLIPTIG
jgi:hypothetical protein